MGPLVYLEITDPWCNQGLLTFQRMEGWKDCQNHLPEPLAKVRNLLLNSWGIATESLLVSTPTFWIYGVISKTFLILSWNLSPSLSILFLCCDMEQIFFTSNLQRARQHLHSFHLLLSNSRHLQLLPLSLQVGMITWPVVTETVLSLTCSEQLTPF